MNLPREDKSCIQTRWNIGRNDMEGGKKPTNVANGYRQTEGEREEMKRELS